MRKQRARGGKRGIISAKYSVSKHLLGRVWRRWLGMCEIFHTVNTGYLKKKIQWFEGGFGTQKTRMPRHTGFNLGWLMGLEPTTTGITIRGSTN